MKAYVTTTIVQEIEVPEGTDKQTVLNFLAEHQSFRAAFEGVTDGECTITDVEVLVEDVESIGEEAYDD